MSLKNSFISVKEETWVILILILSFIYLFTLFIISPGLYGDADSIAHFQLARYAFKYPYHFVDHWGKPLYTTLCTPFAQFGFPGAVAFNILCGLITAWLVYRIAKKLGFSNSLFVIPFSLFAPIYMVTMMTGLTEILFGLVLVAGIYFFLEQKTISSAVIISFIPYARTEGLMFLFIFLVALLLTRRFKAIPFLLTGFIIYSVAGYFHHKDLLWFFTKNPYGESGSEIYGSGSFFYYFGKFDQLMGWPLIALAVIGLFVLFSRLFKDSKPAATYAWITLYILVIGSFFAFLLAHSFLWWQGLFGVLSSKRFMACIMPLGAMMALVGINYILSLFKEKILVKRIVMTSILAAVIILPYFYYQIPAQLGGPYQVMKETGDALKKIGYENKRVLFFDPKLTFYMKEDPFDREWFRYRLSDTKKPEFNQPDSTFLVWDTHFGGFEKQISLDDMLNNPNFRLLDGFVPDKEFRFHEGMNYMSLIFQKVPVKNPQNNWIRVDSIDFETTANEKHQKVLTDTIAYTGKKSNFMNPDHAFGISTSKKLQEISDHEKVIFRGRAMFFIPEKINTDKLMLVLEVRGASDKMFRYVVIPAKVFKTETGKWFEMSLLTPLELNLPEGGYIKFYSWFTGSQKVFVDDMVLEYLPVIR